MARSSHRFSVVALLVGLLSSACFVSRGFAQESTGKLPISDIPASTNALSKIEIGEYPDPDIPEEARPLLTKVKHGARDLVSYILQRSPNANASDLTQAVRSAISSAGVRLLGHEDSALYPSTPEGKAAWAYEERHPYGSVDVELRDVPNHRDLLAATVELSANCGIDRSVYVFQREDDAWRLAMAVEKNGYRDISEAPTGNYEIAQSGDGGWWMLNTDITQWCTSNWRGIQFRALRPGPDAYSPIEMMRGEDGIYLGVDEPLKTRASEKGFDLIFWEHQSLDASILTRPHIRRYRIEGGQFFRVPPVAFSPGGFLDEWLGLTWGEASRWVQAKNSSALRTIHDGFGRSDQSKEEADLKRYVGTEFDFIQRCPGERRWQIGLISDRPTAKEVFFDIREPSKGVYVISSAGYTRVPGCPGNHMPDYDVVGLNDSLPDFPAEALPQSRSREF